MSKDKPVKRDVILVLGMHRSGTSAVTGVLNKLGAAVPANLMEGGASNEMGHFESTLMKEFHDALLLSAGSSWNDWRPFNPSWYTSSEARIFGKEAQGKFLADFGGHPLVALKDPRICRFLPFWLSVIQEMEGRSLAVIPVRSPLEVAMSIEHRDRSSRSKALLLWLRHVIDAEAESRSIPRSLFRWDEFLTNWQFAVRKIAEDIGVTWPRLSDRNKKQIDNFLSESLHHHQVDDDEMDRHPEIHEWIVEVYHALLDLMKDGSSRSALSTLDQVRADFNKSCDLFGRSYVDFEDEIEREKAAVAALQADERHWRSRDEERQKQIEAVRRDADLGAEALADRDRRIEQLVGDLQRMQAEKSDLETRHGRLMEEKAKTEVSLSAVRREKEKAASDLKGRLATQTREADAAIAARDRRIEELEMRCQGMQVTLAQAVRSGQKFQDQIASLREELARMGKAVPSPPAQGNS